MSKGQSRGATWKKKEISDKLRNTFFENILKSDKLILKLICIPTKVSQCNFTRTPSHFSKQTAMGSFDYFCAAELPCVVNLSNMCQYSNTYLFFFSHRSDTGIERRVHISFGLSDQ